jgi:hypothetical protein
MPTRRAFSQRIAGIRQTSRSMGGGVSFPAFPVGWRSSVRLMTRFLDQELEALRQTPRKIATYLYLAQMIIGEPAFAQRHTENIGGGDRVLNREVDADASHRGHRVRRIADAK